MTIRVDFLDIFGLHYQNYVRIISHQWNAVSWEMLAIIVDRTMARIEEDKKPTKRIVDLGSGSTSILFRLLRECEILPKNTEIFSVDHAPFWLERTMLYLNDIGLTTENCLEWDEFTNVPPGVFDIIVFDIGYTNNRPSYFDYVAKNLLNHETDLWLDDMHKLGLRAELLRRLRKYAKTFDVEDFEKAAEHETGRFGSLVNNIVLLE
jgi:methylase of polypeptide subunit release factors